jgi:hypothetical protein
MKIKLNLNGKQNHASVFGNHGGRKMKIHYRKDLDSPDKIIHDVLYIDVIDGNEPVNVVLRNGKELKIRLDRIEAILDDEIAEKEKKE